MYDAWATFVSCAFPFSPSTFVFFFFFSILTPGFYLLPFLNCLQTVGLPCSLSFCVFLSLFLFFRWWECLLLGDGARGEPNIFPLLALPGEADLEQHWTPGFFHITEVFFLFLHLPLSHIHTHKRLPFLRHFEDSKFFFFFFLRVEIKRFWGDLCPSPPCEHLISFMVCQEHTSFWIL